MEKIIRSPKEREMCVGTLISMTDGKIQLAHQNNEITEHRVTECNQPYDLISGGMYRFSYELNGKFHSEKLKIQSKEYKNGRDGVYAVSK